MKRVFRALSVLVLSVVVTHNGMAFAGEPDYGVLSPTHSKSIVSKPAMLVLGSLGTITFGIGVGYFGGFIRGHAVGFAEAKKMYSEDFPSRQSNISSNANALVHATLPPARYQKAMIDQHNLVPFDVSEDNYADAKNKRQYLWARATFLDAHPLHLNEDDIQPALFPLNSGYDPAYPYGYATQICTSSLPAPWAKKYRCNDEQFTGFCRIKFMLNNKVNTLVGMLANTPDNVSGCLLSSRKTDDFLASSGVETSLPRDILVTDKRYYQINVTDNNISYQFQKLPGNPVPFASTVMLSGSLGHESLCKDDVSPGTLWYNDGSDKSEYGCSGLTTEAYPTGNTKHFVPVRLKASASRHSSVTWQEVPSKGDKGVVNTEAQEYFCSPRKPYKEFILGSLGGLGSDKYCRYIDAEGKSGFVATNPDGSIADDYLTPLVDGDIGWQAFESSLPHKAIIAGYSFSGSGKKVSKEPVYFCRFVNDGVNTYGKYFKEGNVCKASFATPNGQSRALIDSKTFEILIGQ